MRWRCSAAHRWKGVAKGNLFRVGLRRNCAPSAFTGPRVSKAMGTNTWVAGKSAYFSDLRTAACSAAKPAEIAVCDKYDAAHQHHHHHHRRRRHHHHHHHHHHHQHSFLLSQKIHS